MPGVSWTSELDRFLDAVPRVGASNLTGAPSEAASDADSDAEGEA